MIPYRPNPQYIWLNRFLFASLFVVAIVVFSFLGGDAGTSKLQYAFVAIYALLGFAVLCMRPWSYVAVFGFMLLQIAQMLHTLQVLVTLPGAIQFGLYFILMGVAIFLRNNIYMPAPTDELSVES